MEQELTTYMNFELQAFESLTHKQLFGVGRNVWKSVAIYIEHDGRTTKFRMLGQPHNYQNVHIVDTDQETSVTREWDVLQKVWSEDVQDYETTLSFLAPSLPKGKSNMLLEYEVVYVSENRFILKLTDSLKDTFRYRVYERDNSLLEVE